MFRPAPMQRLSVLLLASDARAVLVELGRGGAVELTRTGTGGGAAPDTAVCEQLLARIAELRRTLAVAWEVPPLPVAAAEVPALDQATAEKNLAAYEAQTAGLLKRRQLVLLQQAEAAASCSQLTGLEDLEIPLDLPGRAEFLHFVIGTLPGENLARLRAEIGAGTVLVPAAEQGGRTTVIVLATRAQHTQVDTALEQVAFRGDTLPAMAATTTAALAAQQRRERERATTELEQIATEFHVLATEARQPLAELERAVRTERALRQAEQTLTRTAATALLTGWLPAQRAPQLAQRVREVTRGRCVLTLTAPDNAPGEEVPVLLDPPRWLRPFARLVSAFGCPAYTEIEPTLFFAISYLLMFGLMFGDAGHGAVLVLGGLLACRYGRRPATRDTGRLTGYAGLSSLAWGVVYGSYFGLPQFKHLALWRDPLAGDPLRLMTVAVLVGVALISLGLVLNIVNRLRRGDVLGSVLDKFGVTGLVFYWCALFLLANPAALRAQGWVPWTVAVGLLVPVAGWVLREPWTLWRRRRNAAHGLGLALAMAAVESFEGLLLYLANTISFVRLAAYALSHAALLMAFCLMADVVRQTSAAGGLAILMLGNAAALVIEGLIVAVQALRLEYYEFFSKFFAGDGRPFRPFVLGGATP